MKQPTAILLFSRTATAEAEQGLNLKGLDAQLVANKLIRKAEKLARQSGLPLFRSDEQSQLSSSFGENLSTAISQVFAAGFSQVLVMGNDCPQLRLSDLRKCEQKLSAGQTVLGPDFRGGAYLLGLRREDFDHERFAALSWQSASLWSDLQALFPAAYQLRRLRDVNKGEDLLALLIFLRADRYFAVIAQLLAAIKWPPREEVLPPALAYRAATALRGPPVLA
ncbi:MAG: DUF2064 domain-containing protein [Bacteroidota bacterium]